MTTERNEYDQEESDLPPELSQLARRALVQAGYLWVEQLASISEAEVMKLHGVGPKTLDPLRRALASKGLSFAGTKPRR